MEKLKVTYRNGKYFTIASEVDFIEQVQQYGLSDSEIDFQFEYLSGGNEELFNLCMVNEYNLESWFKLTNLDEIQKAQLFCLLNHDTNRSFESWLELIEADNLSSFCHPMSVYELIEDQLNNDNTIPEYIRGFIDINGLATQAITSGNLIEFEFNEKKFTEDKDFYSEACEELHKIEPQGMMI